MQRFIHLSEKTKGIISIILLAFVFATMGIFARYLGTTFSLFEQTYLRIALAFLLGCIFFYKELSFKKLLGATKKDIGLLIFRSITLYLGVVLFTSALLTTKYGNASIITNLPLLPLFGYIFLREKIKSNTVIYIIIGFIGALLIGLSQTTGFSVGKGELMAFLSMLAFDFSYVARKWQSDYLSNKQSTVLMFFFGSIFLFIMSILTGESLPHAPDFSLLIVGALLFSAIFNLLNLFLTNYGFERVKVAVAGNLLALECVFALLYQVILFKEQISIKELIGAVLILISVWLVNNSEGKNKNP